jgi:hypothetical protein
MNNQPPFNFSNVSSAPSAPSTTNPSVPTSLPMSAPDFAQARNHISNFLHIVGNPLAVRHFGNETYYNSVLNRVHGIEQDFIIYLTVMAQEARNYQESLNESKAHAQTELLLTRGKRTYAQLDSRAQRADDRLEEEKEKLAEEERPKKKRSFVAKDSLPPGYPPPPPPPPGASPMEM